MRGGNAGRTELFGANHRSVFSRFQSFCSRLIATSTVSPWFINSTVALAIGPPGNANLLIGGFPSANQEIGGPGRSRGAERCAAPRPLFRLCWTSFAFTGFWWM